MVKVPKAEKLARNAQLGQPGVQPRAICVRCLAKRRAPWTPCREASRMARRAAASTALRSVLSCAGSSYPPATMRQNARATRTLRALLLVSTALGVPAAAGPALAQSLTIDNNTSVTLPSGITTESGGVVVGNTTGTNPAGAPGGQLIVPVGAQLNTPGFTIGNMAGSTGEVIVDGGKIQGIPNTGQNVIGNGGAGVLIIRNGGTVDTTVTPPGGSLTNIGIGPSSMGTLTVEGTGSTYREGGTGAPAFVAALGGGSLATINILAGGAVFSAGTIQIGGTGRATATISGQGSLALAGTSLGVGVLPTAAGSSLTVTDGGRATATTLFYMAFNAGNTASATVSNGGTISGTTLLVGFQGDADLQIQSGGTAVASGSTAIAGGGGSSTVEVSGTGANLMAQGGLLVGGGGDGTLTISGGGIVSVTGNTFIAGQCSDSGGLPVSSCSMANGGPFQGGSGSVTVTGGGSALNSSSALFVGQYGLGSLTISDSGTVLAPGGTMLGGFGGQGTINIGAPAGAAPVGPGTLVTPFVLFGGTNDLLVFNHTDTSGSYVFSPLIEGGAVNVLAGVTTLTANNTYTGPTTVNGGALVVDGSIASSSLTTVNSGAALIGTGTVGQTVINSGGFLVPGHSPGTMTVNGSLAFQSGAFYVVQVNPATASNTNVSGTATLAGTVAAVFAPGAYTKQSYPILTAAGGSWAPGSTASKPTVCRPTSERE